MSRCDEGICDLRPPDSAAPTAAAQCDQRRDIDGEAERGQPIADFTNPAFAMDALRIEEFEEWRVRRIQKVREQVHVAAVFDRGDLDAGNQTHAVITSSDFGFGQPCARVVVGDADRSQSGLRRARDERSRR